MSFPGSERRDLSALFRPRSVAVIGASGDTGHVRGRITAQLLNCGYSGRIFLVSPRGGEILGRATYPTIAALPEAVDLALIAIPADAVAGVLEECAAAGVRAAYIFSSGFAEEGGARRELQSRIREIARRTGMMVAGPNAVGLMNVGLSLVASFTPAVDLAVLPRLREAVAPRRIAVVSQSGGLAFAFFNRGLQRRLPFSYVVNTGNEADLDIVDAGEFLLDDPQTGVVLMFVEQVRRGPEFIAMARRSLRLGKPIVVAKIGRSAAARRAAISHTASLTGSDAAYEAVFRRYGVIRGDDQDDMLDVAAAAALCPEPKGTRAGVITISGGVGGWLADTLETNGLLVPEFSAGLQAKIRAFLPSYGAAGNPIDITGQAIGTDFRVRALEALEASDEIDAIVVASSLAADTRLSSERPRLKEIAGRSRKPILFYTYPLPAESARAELDAVGVPLYTSMRGVARALYLLAERVRAAETDSRPEATLTEPASGYVAAARRLDRVGDTLTESEAFEILGDYGIAVPERRLAASVDEAARAAAEIGFPVALKVQSPEIPHKTDAGALALGLTDDAAVRTAYETVLANARRAVPNACIHGVLVEAMAKPGLELLLGVNRDDTFGPMLLLGRGGVDAELVADRVMTPLPIDEAEAERLIDRLDRGRMMQAHRGRPARDHAALARLMVMLGRLAWDFRDRIREIDLNPVIVGADGEGVAVVDALMVQETRER
ncbi:MAG TPA: acetate--CoA ligase family protein [Stellaceae bacterium]|nr:acetate--CoA ligase family protein [Stellaceae bacterium]